MARQSRECLNNWVITLDSSEKKHWEIIREVIQKQAYAIFESRGSVDGFDLDDWTTAERQVLQNAFDGHTSEFLVRIACPKNADVTTILSITSRSMIVFRAGKGERLRAEKGPEVFSVCVFPEEIVPADVEVKTADGVLHIRLPKKKEQRKLV